jgi:hypothetical protein
MPRRAPNPDIRTVTYTTTIRYSVSGWCLEYAKALPETPEDYEELDDDVVGYAVQEITDHWHFLDRHTWRTIMWRRITHHLRPAKEGVITVE